METIYPRALRAGDEVRLVAPSSSMSQYFSPDEITLFQERMEEELGVKITLGRHALDIDPELGRTTDERKLEDLHEAFDDKKVAAVICAVGGSSAQRLLGKIDYSHIRKTPKIFLGFSDGTHLTTAINAKTGLVTFLGADFSAYRVKEPAIRGYCSGSCGLALKATEEYEMPPAGYWIDNGLWWKDESEDNCLSYSKNSGPVVLREGEARGKAIAGTTFCLKSLFGTGYMPDLEGSVMFLEKVPTAMFGMSAFLEGFSLASLSRQKDFHKIAGIVFGKSPPDTRWGIAEYNEFLESPEVRDLNIPIIAEADFGHVMPTMTVGSGGPVNISAQGDKVTINLGPFVVN